MNNTYTNYNGNVKTHTTSKQRRINWIELGVWLFTIIISLLPVAFSMLSYYDKHKTIDIIFWIDTFINGDILWLFATELLFAIVNNTLNNKMRLSCLSLMGIIIFLCIEGLCLYGMWNLNIDISNLWFLKLGSTFSIVALLISTPLQLTFKGGEK